MYVQHNSKRDIEVMVTVVAKIMVIETTIKREDKQTSKAWTRSWKR